MLAGSGLALAGVLIVALRRTPVTPMLVRTERP